MAEDTTRLKVLYPRKFTGKDGQEGTQWMHVGRAFMNSRGIDVQLWVSPLPNNDGHIRLILREDDGQGAQAPDGGHRGQRGDGQRFQGGFQGQGGPPPGQGGYGPQGGAQAPQGAGLRPQHRDGLSDGQRAQYGGAAAERQREPGDDDILPF